MATDKSETWWHEGVRFECQGSGKCCVSRGEYGYVYLSLKDRQRLAAHLGLSTRSFTRRFCEKTEGYFHIKANSESPECLFLKNNQCSVYEGRPTQCRTWPFWPENMNAKSWRQDVANFCPGVGKGPVWSQEAIQAQLDEQAQSEV